MMWLTFVAVVIVSFASLIFMRPVAEKIGLVDKPNFRKRHQGLIPLIGGIALFLGNLTFYAFQYDTMPLPGLYLLSVTILLFIGVLDDRFDISPALRAGIQAVLAGAMIYSGLELESLGQIIAPFSIKLGFFSLLFTVFITIGVINAFNMVDGIDGLLAGLSSVSFAGIGVLMWINGEHAIAFWCLAIILTLIPYAMFNLSLFGAKWKVFMGDSGSTLIGFTIIWMLLLSTQGQGHAISPFRPDRLHLHHLLMRAGLTSRQALAVITFWAAVCATIGVLGEVNYWDQSSMVIGFIALFFLYAYSIVRAWKITRFVRRLKRRVRKSAVKK